MTRQYEFLCGRWVDTWNGCQAEPFHDWNLSSLIVDACGCIADNVADLLAEYLQPARPSIDPGDRILILDGSTENLLIAIIADNLDLTEHGTSIAYAWLTPAGESWLKLYDADHAQEAK